MKTVIDPGTREPGVNFISGIIYAHGVPSLVNDKPIDLEMSLAMPGVPPRELQGNPNVEIEGRLTEKLPKLPTILWLPGGGWRGQDRNQMICELAYFVKAGFVVACIDYRNSAQAKYPAQIEDVKTAVRFLRKRGAPYWVDPDRICVMGRSAGGHLSAIAAMNLDDHETDEWSGVSSHVQCAVDLFGPADMEAAIARTQRHIQQPGFRWNRIEQTHEYCLLGNIEPETMRAASPIRMVHKDMASILIMHGDADPIVPYAWSEKFYEKINEVCPGRADFVGIKGASHGSEEFWQVQTRQLMLDWLNAHL